MVNMGFHGDTNWYASTCVCVCVCAVLYYMFQVIFACAVCIWDVCACSVHDFMSKLTTKCTIFVTIHKENFSEPLFVAFRISKNLG